MSHTKAEWVEDLPRVWDTQDTRDVISVPLTSSEYEALREIGAVSDDEARPLPH